MLNILPLAIYIAALILRCLRADQDKSFAIPFYFTLDGHYGNGPMKKF